MELAFRKTRANDRKRWLSAPAPAPAPASERAVPAPASAISTTVSVHDFVHQELVEFSRYDNVRSIPHLMDGLKPSQRKVIYATRQRGGNKEIKVSQLSGYVSTETLYHHGEQSLMGTIVNLAQTFVGSGNNIGLLAPKGQFGTRLMGGKDAASPRYIFTHLTAEAH
eukprot:4475343-Pyramimonas_sp.AAC.1